MVALTNTAIDAMQPGQELKDDRVPGLSVRRHAHGRSFMLYYRTRGGDQRRPKIGEYPTLTLAQAREIARAMLAKVSAGDDPGADRAALRAAPTMADLWGHCEREHWNRGKEWDKAAKLMWNGFIAPAMGARRVGEVTYDDVKRLHDKLRAHPTQANRVVAVLSKMFNLAEIFGPETAKWRPTGSNPCQHVERFRERKRKRYATPAEIAALGAILDRHAAQAEHLTGVAFIYLMLFSGARPSEIENGTPDMLERREKDGTAYGVLRLDEGKTGARDVFMPPQAMAVLDKLPAGRASLAGRKTLPRALWKAVCEEAAIDGLWIRDLRRTFATIGMSMGVAPGQIGELLGHASAQTTKIYAKLMEDAAHDAAAVVAGRMEELLGSR